MRNRKLTWVLVAGLLAGCSTAPEKKPETLEKQKTGTHAPDHYRVRLDTSKGPVVLEVTRAWAPHAADRYYELVKSGFYDEARFYRVVRNFVAQFGINKDPKMSQLWGQLKMVDDPPQQKNKRGTLTFATSGPNTRTTQVFINLSDNRTLDGSGFVPFAKVVQGMDVVDSFYKVYGDTPPRGSGPDGVKIQALGN
ncbi:MAG TPA: peptidylprolyl isomerase, partial [Bryobacteraceae bacterium]|nr:peptidylprolyl isomerase [Bryobacteraceae bacterium]